MAFDKAKTIQDAQKYVQKGALDKAIREYEKLAKADPKDVNPRMKIAGLLAKLGKIPDSLKAYESAAAIYCHKGFFNKAVAVYKQMLQVDPTYVDGYLRLADVFQKMGLTGDAVSQYKTVVSYYEREGQALKALETLKTMAQLDPGNVATQVKLAEIYFKQNMADDGRAQLHRVIQDLTASKRHDELLKVYERLLHFDPDNAEALGSCYRLLLELKRHDQALPVLQRYLRVAKDDLQAIRDVADIFGRQGNTKNQKIALKELAKRLHAEGKDHETHEIYQKVLLLDPSDPTALSALGAEVQAAAEETIASEGDAIAMGDAETAVVEEEELVMDDGGVEMIDEEAVEEVLIDETPEPATAAVESVPVVAEEEISDEEVKELLTESDVYVKYGLRPKAIGHLKRVAMLRPDRVDALELLVKLMQEEGDISGGADIFVRAGVANANAGHEDLAQRAYELALILDPSNAAAQAATGGAAPAESISFDEVEAAMPADAEIAMPDTASEEEIVIDEPEAPAAEEEIVIEEPVAPAAASLEIEVEEPAAASSLETEIEIEAPATAAPSLEEEISIEEPAAPPSLEEEISIEEPAAVPSSLEEEVSFGDLAEPSLEEQVSAQEPSAPVSLEDEINVEEPAAPPPPPVATAPKATSKPVPAAAPPKPALAPAAAARPAAAPVIPIPAAKTIIPAGAPYEAPPVDPHMEELDEAEFYMSQDIHDEARAIYEKILAASPGHPVATAKLAEIKKSEAKAEASPPPPASPLLAGSNEEVPFDDVFDAFKKGVDANVAREDSATHYDLGIAYKEMGLLDDAIREFVTAIGGVGARKADCYNMIGLIHLQKGEATEAADAFQRGLAIENASPFERMGIKFELASTLAALDRKGEALTLFEEIEGEDSDYRDVGEKIIELKSEGITAEPVQGIGGMEAAASGRRVSYV